MKSAALVLLVPLLLGAARVRGEAGGGAWVRTAGGYYFKLGFTSLTADREYGFRGEDRPLFRDTSRYRNGTIGISNITLYGERGITDWLTGVVSTHFAVAVREADDLETGLTASESASGLADTWLSGRVQLLPDSWPVAGAVTLGWKIPTGSPNKKIPLGDGVADYEAALALGRGFRIGEDRFGYAQAGGAYRLRNRFADEIHWYLEGGVKIIPTLGLQAVLDGVHSTLDFESETAQLEEELFNRLVGSQSFTRISGGLLYDLSDEMELTVQVAGTLDGTNTLDAGSFSIGVAWKKKEGG